MATLIEQRYGKAQVRVLKILRDGPVHTIREELRPRGVPEDVLAKVYAPIGLDIGADSPTEIAVSVVAEILAILRKRVKKICERLETNQHNDFRQ
jgi:xanthine/CO dehydrogenase XdhC/CoxF family maturation factor